MNLAENGFNEATSFVSLGSLSCRALGFSNGFIVKTTSPTKILRMNKFVHNLIIYKKDSSHFHVGIT
jgi:hypothetical protein